MQDKILNYSLNSSRWVHLLIVAVLIVITYHSAVTNGFNVDDGALLTQNASVHGLSVSNLKQLFTSVPNELEYLPVRDVSYAIEYSAWGLKPFGYHISNIAYFILVCSLVYVFVERLANGGIPEAKSLALFTAVLFAVHPVHVEVVAGIAQRKDVLAALFLLLSLYFYSRFRETSRARLYWAALGAFVLALFSKASAVTLPFLVLGLDAYWPRTDKARWREPIFRAIPFFLIAVIYTVFQSAVLLKTGVITSQKAFSPFERLMLLPASVTYYLKMLTIPTHLYWIHPFVADRPGIVPAFYAEIAMVVILCAAAWYLRRKLPIAGFAIYCFLATVLPVSGLVPTTGVIVADRYLFIPSLGFCIFLAYIVHRCWLYNVQSRIVSVIALIALVSGYAAISLKRVPDWRDEVSLHLSNIRDFPAIGTDPGLKLLKARLYVLTAKACYAKKRKAEAFGYLEEAVRLDPSRGLDAAIFAASEAYFARNLDEALRVLDNISAFNKSDIFEVNFLYGKVLYAKGDYVGARRSFEHALTSKHDLGLISVSRRTIVAQLESFGKER
ncbi:MAG: tetratricopeptide repeat protein [Geobacter sp.]|nr:tetratricopeptide repeat protein [Geobacter sp.]